jgi:hypothetical protein
MLASGSAVAAQEESAQRGVKEWAPLGRVDPGVVRELSGVVASRRRPGVFWTHGDSGAAPELVAFDTTGKVLARVALAGAPNTDWEDLTADDQGHLYVGDIGNSAKLFPARYVYKIIEPDPLNPPAQPVSPIERYRYRYPRGEDGKARPRFDAESLFWYQGGLYLLSKSPGRDTVLYRMQQAKAPADRPSAGDMKLVPVATLDISMPTGADVSSDGKHLAVCSYGRMWLYPLLEAGAAGPAEPFHDSRNARAMSYSARGNVEGCCFWDRDVVLVSEDGYIYRISAEDFDQRIRYLRHRARPKP